MRTADEVEVVGIAAEVAEISTGSIFLRVNILLSRAMRHNLTF